MSEPPYYAPTAYDGRRERAGGHPARAGRAQHPMRDNTLPGGVHCREFLAVSDPLAIDLLKSDSAALRRQLAKPVQERLRWITLANPAGCVSTVVTVAGWMAAISGVGSIFMLMAHFDIWTLTGIALFVGGLASIYLIGKLLLRYRIVPDKNNVVFNRRTGMVHIPARGGAEHVVPFAECNGAIRVGVSGTGGYQYYLRIVHRDGAGAVCPRHRVDTWKITQDWEYLQAFMDASRPLPDIAEMEGYRPRDPVTAKHDRKTGRPPDFWKTLPEDKARALYAQSCQAAQHYPWGLTREAALTRGWCPSPAGQGWPVKDDAHNGEAAAK